MQLLLVIGLGLLITLLNLFFAYSFVLGGLLNILANWIFAYKLFANNGARKAKKIASGFYLGEALKLVITSIGFGLFAIIGLSPLYVLLGYFLAQLGLYYWTIKLKI